MKVLKVVLIVILVLVLIVIVGAAIFLSRFDVNAYLEPIKQQASSALGRQVDIDHAKLDLNFIKGVSLAVDGISIADDPAFSKGKFLSLDHLNAGLDVMALLLKKQIIVTQLSIDGVNVHLIKNKEGQLNTPTPPASQSKSQDSAKAKDVPSGDTYQQMKPMIFASSIDPTMPAKPDTSHLPNLLINSIDIRHLKVRFEDKTPAFPLDIVISEIQIGVKDLSLVNPFNVLINAALFSEQQNLSINFTMALDIANQAATISNLNVSLPVESVQLAKVKSISPNLAAISLPERAKGNLKLYTDSFNASAKGVDGLNLNIKFDDGLVKLSQLPAALTAVTTEMNYVSDGLEIKSLKSTIGSNGKIDIKGQLNNLSKMPRYNFTIDAKGLEVKDLVDEAKVPIVIKSALDFQSTISGVSFDPIEAMINLNGNVGVNVMEGKLEKLNIVNQMVDKLKDVAIVGPVISEMFKTGVDGYLGMDVTQLNSATLSVNISSGTANIENFKLDTPQVLVEAKGKVLLPRFETAISVDTRLSPEVSAQLVKKIDSLKGLQDSNGSISFPGSVSGVVPSIAYKADVSYITKRVATNEAANALGQQLDKVIQKNPEVGNILNSVLGTSSSDGGQAQVSNDGAQHNQSDTRQQSGEDMINNLLKKVIK